MNIKGLNPNLINFDPRLRTEGKDTVRLKNSAERDGNGQREQAEPEQKRHLTDEEFELALNALKEIQAVSDHNLTIRVEHLPDCRIVYIEDPTGKVIHRLSEANLWLVTRDKDRPTGKILDKSG